MAKLDVRALGFALGIVWGAAMLIMGLLNMWLSWGGAFEEVMSTVYLGYKPTLLGSIIGGVWGFVDAGIAGLIIGWLYNKLAR